jgi:hypothetical protein
MKHESDTGAGRAAQHRTRSPHCKRRLVSAA